jgi:hypothetical protein
MSETSNGLRLLLACLWLPLFLALLFHGLTRRFFVASLMWFGAGLIVAAFTLVFLAVCWLVGLYP